MSFSNTSQTQFRYAVEATQNQIPAVAFQNITAKSGALEANQTFTVSQGIRTDRTVQDNILTDRKPGGTLVYEFAYGVADPILAATLQDAATWNQTTNFSNVAVTAGTPNVFTVPSGGAAVLANMLLYASGFTNSGNDGVFKASSSTGTTITTATAPSTAETAGAGKTLKVIGYEGASGDITATSTGLASTTLDFTTLGLSVGLVVKVGGSQAANQFATAANNDYVRITGIAAHALTCDNLPTGWTTDAGAGKAIRLLWGDTIANGVTRNSFTVEEDHPDISFTREFTGHYPDQFQLKMTPGQILEATTTWKGMSVSTGTATASTGTPIAAPNNSIMNAVTSVVRINEAGVASGKMSDATLMIKNNLGDVMALGVLGDADVRDGQFNATLQFGIYMSATQGQSIYSKFLAGTQSSLWFVLKDAAGNAYAVDMPAGRFTDAKTPVSGINQDYKLTGTFTTQYDSVSGKQMRINRIASYGA